MKIKSFVLPFSELPGLQSANKITYLLEQTDARLEITVHSENSGCSKVVLPQATTLDQASALLQLLYENAVEPSSLSDILSDCLALQKI